MKSRSSGFDTMKHFWDTSYEYTECGPLQATLRPVIAIAVFYLWPFELNDLNHKFY